MTVIDAGAAWDSVPDGDGVVRACFSQAVHVEIGRDLLVIVQPPSPPGPLHLRVEPLPHVAPGDGCRLMGGRLRVGQDGIDLHAVPRWRPAPIGRPLLGVALPHSSRSALAGERDLVRAVATSLRAGDLDGVAHSLGGLGPGLTPAGDDVLAGIVLTLHASGVDEARLRTAVERVVTSDLARAYLRWAARGQSIAPAHEVLHALTTGDVEDVAATSSALCSHGASSGADLLLGIDLAVASLPLVSVRGQAVRTGAAPATRP
jgi:hypothetical protein